MSDKLDLRRIATEQRNPRTAHIDELPTIDMVRLINSEDKKVAEAWSWSARRSPRPST